jgi:hypothetical protein
MEFLTMATHSGFNLQELSEIRRLIKEKINSQLDKTIYNEITPPGKYESFGDEEEYFKKMEANKVIVQEENTMGF